MTTATLDAPGASPTTYGQEGGPCHPWCRHPERHVGELYGIECMSPVEARMFSLREEIHRLTRELRMWESAGKRRRLTTGYQPGGAAA